MPSLPEKFIIQKLIALLAHPQKIPAVRLASGSFGKQVLR